MLAVLGVGFYFFKKNKSSEDYYVGGRSISPSHVGLSIAATDVGGGFSIGLGGLGYAMGLSGSWLLFTGLMGAWLSAVFIIPKIKRIDIEQKFMTYPDFLRFKYDKRVAITAAIISAIGYTGFTSGQILAGAKLMSGSVINQAPFGIDSLTFSLYVIGIIIVGYTVLGGLKAVIYTDTVQWIILILGLILFAIPFAVHSVGGLSVLKEELPSEFLSLTNIKPITFINWLITIVPIWLVAMTLYQRIYATKDVKDAKKAWFIAGAFEYPVMAFTGVILGMISSILIPGVEAEMGVPILLKKVLPIGITGIVVASYFSAIMSTADSCIIAASGNITNDLIEDNVAKNKSNEYIIRISQVITLIIGIIAILLASYFTTVLNAILYAYQFMVAGLAVPTFVAIFWKKANPVAAFYSMITGGSITIILLVLNTNLPLGLDATFYGIITSAITIITLSKFLPYEPR